jgi:CubicO group peptidase (beta-lactamase class C family)
LKIKLLRKQQGMKLLFLIFALLIAPGFLGAQIDFSTPAPDPRFAPADSAILAGEFGEIHSLLVIENGRLVFEKYYKGWTADSLHQLQSATKSVVATLFGCAVQQGFLTGPDEKVARFFPGTDLSDARKGQIRIADLLTQRHGLRWSEGAWEDPKNTWRKVIETEGDWFSRILETPMDTLPGRVFNYSNAAPALTAGIVQAASGMDIDVFAKKYLFEPLGIRRSWFWPGNGGAAKNGMALISLTPRDMAKIGQLYLQNGLWNGTRVLPENFVAEATAPKVQNVAADGVYSGYDYGWFWWSNGRYRGAPDRKPAPTFMARGAGGQNIVVWPEKNAVVVITAWNIARSNLPLSIFDKWLWKKW